MVPKHFENDYTKMSIEEGILFIAYKAKLRITLDVAKQCVLDRQEFCEGKAYPMVAILNGIQEPDKEAKKFLSSPEAMKGIKAGAFVVENHLYRLIGTIFISLYVKLGVKTPPAQLFSNKAKAIEWTKKYSQSSIK